MVNLKGCVAVVGMLFLASCAPTATKDSQYISVTTTNSKGSTARAMGAICTLSNAQGQWQLDKTPGSVMIERDSSDLTVSCVKDNQSGKQVVAPKMHGKLLKDVVTGEINAVEVNPASHKAYYYPEHITVVVK